MAPSSQAWKRSAPRFYAFCARATFLRQSTVLKVEKNTRQTSSASLSGDFIASSSRTARVRLRRGEGSILRSVNARRIDIHFFRGIIHGEGDSATARCRALWCQFDTHIAQGFRGRSQVGCFEVFLVQVLREGVHEVLGENSGVNLKI